MTTLDDLFKAGGNTATDPVCEMTVDTVDPSGGTAEYQDQTYYFCGVGCRQSFIADPAKFV